MFSPLLHTRLYTFLFFLLFFHSSASSTSVISYKDHCGSIIHELSQKARFHDRSPLIEFVTTYYNGGEKILGKKPSSDESFFDTERSLSFRTTRNVYITDQPGIYKIEAYLKLPIPPKNGQTTHFRAVGRESIRFLLNGFWNESSGRLCAVGSVSSRVKGGKLVDLAARLELSYGRSNSTIFTSLVNGTLESLSPSSDAGWFERISIYALPELFSYDYTLVTEDFGKGLPQGFNNDPASESRGLPSGQVCSTLSSFGTFDLEYPKGCSVSKSCSALNGVTAYLPGFMSMYAIQCSEAEQKVRYVMEFPNSTYRSDYYYYPADLKATWIGEGSWDRGKKRLNVVACRILNSPGEQAQVSNCSIMLTLRFPATLTIRNSSGIIGQLWTNETVKNSSYFKMITVRHTGHNWSPLSALSYEYTELERAKRICPLNKPGKSKADKYPRAHSQDMRLYMSVKSSSTEFGWGDVTPISVGPEMYEPYGIVTSTSGWVSGEIEDEESINENGLMNISYKLTLNQFSDIKLADKFYSSNLSSGHTRRVEITAEGVYNSETGQLCMVGCRRLSSSTHNLTGQSVDCDIAVDFDFPPVSTRKKGVIKGSIRSMRRKTDPLYFGVLNLTSNAFYWEEGKEFIWRMDIEIIMVLISNTLACIFVALQLFHMKKHPEMLPSISLVMLVILTLGHLIPLVINFEALFLHNKDHYTHFMRGGWLEVNEVIVRVITLVAFLLVSRLLLLAWTARSSDDKKGLWAAERKVLFLSSPVYIAGGLIAILVHWKRSTDQNGSPYNDQNPILGDLRSYAGLVVDGFLLPQILLNIFLHSTESVLSPAFYAGTTLVRLVPHAYDLYRIHEYAQYYLQGSYVYANPRADFFCKAWDIIISCGGILLAVVTYLQQRFGSRFILPKRFRGFDLYEKVPTTSAE